MLLALLRTASAAELGPAPQFDAPQDTTGWTFRNAPKAAMTRDAVASLYKTMYLPEASVALTWTGAISGCNPGATNIDHQNAVLGRVNYYRALVGLPAVGYLTATETAQAQAAALIMAANGKLSHSPDSSWTCYSADGLAGASSSNIALGAKGVDAIDLYMDDFGSGGNAAVGHRRWILYPPQVGMATGDVAGGGNWPANDLYVFGRWGSRPATPNGIAWPPAGYVPYQNLPAQSSRWSISYPGANFSGATVTMTGPSGAFPITYEAIANGYGDNTLVFIPAGFPYGKPAADTTYTINVTGIQGSGVPTSLQYTVTVIDPLVAGPAGSTVASDFDLDGRSDVFWRNTASGTNAIWNVTGSAASQFTAGFLPGVPATWQAVGTGDVNGDGIADVVWFQPTTGQVAIWLMSSPTIIASATFPATVPAGWVPVAIGDLNGDTRADLVWRNATGQLLVWYMAATGNIGGSKDYGIVSPAFELRGVGDFNNDGIDDLMWFRATDGVVALWLIAANGASTAVFPGAVGAGTWKPYRAVDLDGDGVSDILWRDSATGMTAAWYMSGAGALADYDFFVSVPVATWQLGTTGDFDMDTRNDLMWYSPVTGGVVRWLMNGRHVAPTAQAVSGVGTGWQMVP